VHGHCAAALDLLVVQSAGARRSRVVPHLFERPREIDRDHVGDRPALELDLFVRKSTLVEEDDPRAVLLVANDVFGI
jgi:hypothetical protein